jgi:drug/metabolite transporter (DMT)-like permease
MTGPDLRDLVVVSCAISAGVHAALVPEHYRESPALGVSFAVAAILLSAIAIVLARRSDDVVVAVAAAVVFLGLIVSYVLAITTGLPVLHPQPESVEGLAVATKGVEAIGLYAAAGLLVGHGPINFRTKGQMT